MASEKMCWAIRALTEARGHDAADHDLVVFGGAGGQHACSIAANLHIRHVIPHKYSSILSSYVLALGAVVCGVQDLLNCVCDEASLSAVKSKANELLQRG